MNRNFKNFFVFEGCEGTGKSTQARLAADVLQKEGYPAWLTKEPGGTPFGEKIRNLILFEKPKEGISSITEFLLFEANRREHMAEIARRCGANEIVICDRFSYSTFAYQGYGRGLFMQYRGLMESVDEWVRAGISPRLIFLFDQDVEIGLMRKHKQGENNQFEKESLDFHKKVRRGFLEMCQHDTLRWHLIDARRSIEDVHNEIMFILHAHLKGVVKKQD